MFELEVAEKEEDFFLILWGTESFKFLENKRKIS